MKKWQLILVSSALLAAFTACGNGEIPAETAPADAVSGASQKAEAETQLPQEEIRSLALDYLRGFPLIKEEDGTVSQWAYREMYQIATVHDNMPGLSSVEFVIDPSNMHLYASCEKGTEKVQDIAENNNVVLYWYHQLREDEYVPQVNDYFNSYGVQIKGTARLMDGSEEGFYQGAGLYMRSLYGAEMWDQMPTEKQHEIIDRLKGPNEWVEIIPDSYIVNTLSWSFNAEDSRRPQYYDPDSPYFGKSVRQVYEVTP